MEMLAFELTGNAMRRFAREVTLQTVISTSLAGCAGDPLQSIKDFVTTPVVAKSEPQAAQPTTRLPGLRNNTMEMRWDCFATERA